MLKKIIIQLLEKWNSFKVWSLNVSKRFKKHWFMIVNYIVIVLAYNNIYGKESVTFAEVLLGLWIFASIAYAGWKWFNKQK